MDSSEATLERLMEEGHYLKNELYELIRTDSAIFEFLQRGSLDGLWYWDLEKPDHEWMSARFWETLGYDPAEREHLASEWQDLIHPEDLEAAGKSFERHCADPSHPYDLYVRYRHREGSTVWVRCRGMAIRDSDGRAVRMLGAHTDVTALKEAEQRAQELASQLESRNRELAEANQRLQAANDRWERTHDELQRSSEELLASEARFRKILENAPVMIDAFDSQGRCTLWNRECEKRLGFTREELNALAEPMAVFYPDPEERAAALDSIKAANGTFREFNVRDVNDEKRIQQWANFRLPSDEVIAVGYDVTELRGNERALEEALRNLKQSNEALQQFAYVASHDLQEPLRMVATYTALLQKEYAGKLDEEADLFIHYAVDGAERMRQMIKGLLTLSRVEAQVASHSQRLDANNALNDALANLTSAIRESGAEIETGELPRVWAEQTTLTTIFQNLIGNAIKFRGAQTPRIRVGTIPCDGGWTFFVEDNGIGLNTADRERIFQVFQRLHDRHEYPGTGIGLAVVKRGVESLGGKVWLTSVPGQGTTFFFSLRGVGTEQEVVGA
ncbi:MAG: ATP-binding protein [Myxococcota bacterium]